MNIKNGTGKREYYLGREFERREHKECDPPDTFFDPDALQFDNEWHWELENCSQTTSREDISGIEIPPERRLPCTPSSTSTIPQSTALSRM